MPEIYSNSLQPYWSTTDNLTTLIYLGDVREVCYKLPSQSVQCIVTSPPYWALRDYKTGSKFEIGSEPIPDCMTYGQAQCEKCFVCTMVEVFRSVRRVLRDDGTLWLNLGDTYASSGTNRNGKSSKTLDKGGEVKSLTMDVRKSNHGMKNKGVKGLDGVKGLKTGNLIGIPWRVALALQNDGWILRQEIIWHKPNCMPDSVKNRCTKAHEHIFLFAKHPGYYYDNEAIKDKDAKFDSSGVRGYREGVKDNNATLNQVVGSSEDYTGGNKRSVWYVPTHSYPGSHYATFPPKLIEPCILAGTSEKGCCSECGKCYRRILKPNASTLEALEKSRNGQDWYARKNDNADKLARDKSGEKSEAGYVSVYKTVGWKPQCTCKAKVTACTILDPFFGSGTTGEVCIKHKRNCIGIELSAQYVEKNAIPRVCSAIQKYRTTRLDLIPE